MVAAVAAASLAARQLVLHATPLPLRLRGGGGGAFEEATAALRAGWVACWSCDERRIAPRDSARSVCLLRLLGRLSLLKGSGH